MREQPERRRPAWYAASPGTWRDWASILHPPYTAWHLSYVLVGAGLATHVNTGRLLATLGAFALAVGLAAHALDELRGRPLGTTISAPVLEVTAALALGAAAALGIIGVSQVGWGLTGFIAAGVFFVVSYNLELWNGKLHNDIVFALAWGAFPLLTGYYAQTATIRPAAILAAVFAYGLSRAQRTLSTDARNLRRRVASVQGEIVLADETRWPITRDSLLRPLERTLVSLSWSTCALGVALVLARSNL